MKRIHHVVDIDTPVATLWAALTEAQGLTSWWSTRLNTSAAAVGTQLHWTFAGDYNPVMEITTLEEERELGWSCIAGHTQWKDNIFRFRLVKLEDGRTRLRFWQDYAVELDDDSYGFYNFNWGYYLESLRLFCIKGKGKPFQVFT
ncbi:MAG TPA: SRPBCC domain-containing protein [Ktedonobacteraceae bacterium]